MKKNIIVLIISATLIGGMGTTAYASVGPNVTKTTYSNCNQVNSNVDKLSEQINKKGLIKYTYQGGFGDVKNNCVKYFQGILSGNKIVESTVSTEEANTTENNTDVDTTSQDTNNQDINNQVNDESGQVTENEVKTNTQEDKEAEVTVTIPEKETTKEVTTTPKTEIEKPNTTTPKTETAKPDTTTPTQTPVVQAPTTNVSDSFMAKVEQLIFQRVNQERAKAGLSTLTYNTTMEKYARYKSKDMGDKGYFDHEDLQGNLITVKMENEGVSYKAWGENIAYIGGVSDENALATQFMDNWMNSPGHRANILSNNFSSIGVGVYKIGNKVYATQEFYK